MFVCWVSTILHWYCVQLHSCFHVIKLMWGRKTKGRLSGTESFYKLEWFSTLNRNRKKNLRTTSKIGLRRFLTLFVRIKKRLFWTPLLAQLGSFSRDADCSCEEKTHFLSKWFALHEPKVWPGNTSRSVVGGCCSFINNISHKLLLGFSFSNTVL